VQGILFAPFGGRGFAPANHRSNLELYDMALAPNHESTRSLAAAQSGELLEIKRILFSGLRRHCAELGLAEGQRVKCRAGTASRLMLETETGRTVALERDWARFIQTAPAADVLS